jgi:hypothetical protein
MTEPDYSNEVSSHPFEPVQNAWGNYAERANLCGAIVRTDPTGVRYHCGRPYGEHVFRPALPTEILDTQPNLPNRFGMLGAHKFGCAATTSPRGACNCGMVETNLGSITFLLEKFLGAYEDYIRPQAGPHDTLPSSEFRKNYASLERVTDVTVNGRLQGWWTPADIERETSEPTG